MAAPLECGDSDAALRLIGCKTVVDTKSWSNETVSLLRLHESRETKGGVAAAALQGVSLRNYS